MHAPRVTVFVLVVACHSSTSPTKNPLLDSITVNGQWTATDSVLDMMILTLQQIGDSVHGQGTVAGVPVTVLGDNLTPQRCAPGACEVPPEVSLQVTDAAGDTMQLAAHFGYSDSNQLGVFGWRSGPAPGIQYLQDTLTLHRVRH